MGVGEDFMEEIYVEGEYASRGCPRCRVGALWACRQHGGGQMGGQATRACPEG